MTLEALVAFVEVVARVCNGNKMRSKKCGIRLTFKLMLNIRIHNESVIVITMNICLLLPCTHMYVHIYLHTCIHMYICTSVYPFFVVISQRQRQRQR